MKKLFALLLAMVMVMSLATTAFADDAVGGDGITTEPDPAFTGYTITVRNKDAVVKHTYEVYQIFGGDLDEVDGMVEGTHVLSDVQWGTGVDGAALFAELTTLAETNEKYPTFYAKYQEALTAGTNNEDDNFENMSQAGQMAEVLGNNSNNPTLVSEFAKAAEANLHADKHTVLSVQDGSNNTVYEGFGYNPGYYLIKDKDGSLNGTNGTNETYTNYMLQVVGQTDINSKGGTVTVDKVIVDGTQDVEVADFSIGDHVTFDIYGTIPSNYAKFTKFEYKFVDTMSKGLTYDEGTLKVYLQNSNEPALELAPTTGDHTNYTVTTTKNSDGTTTLTVAFPNLKTIPNRTIDVHTKFILEYTATLNDNAVIGGNGNKNSVKIVYDNDPYSDFDGETPEDHVYAFTVELDVTKVNGQEKDAAGNYKPLAGAKFVLFRRLQGEPNYARVNAEGKVIGWTQFKNQAEIDTYATDNNKDDAWKAAQTVASVLTSNSNGKLGVKGLEADLYHLEEIASPDGFNMLEGIIDVDIEATYAETDNSGNIVTDGSGASAKVVTLTIQVDYGNLENGNTETGVVEMEVINNPGAELPETGGMGTTLFYVIGSVLVMGALVMLITKKRMAAEN